MDRNRPLDLVGFALGLTLIALGGLFLMARVFILRPGRVLWPLFILLPGLLLVLVRMFGGRRTSFVSIPASILSVLGALLFYQNLSGHWESWAYAWSLVVPTAVGIGLVLHGRGLSNHTLHKNGTTMIRVGLAIFFIGGIFFEMILAISDFWLARYLWPILTVLLGMYLILRQSEYLRLKRVRGSGGRQVQPTSPPSEASPQSANLEAEESFSEEV